MPYRYYCPKIKVLTIKYILEGKTADEVRELVDETVSNKSMKRWVALYERTRRVIRDPAEYESRGPSAICTAEEREFMTELVAQQPMLFLDEIREQLYDETGVLPSRETVAFELNHRLHLTSKKANTSHINKDFQRKEIWWEQMRNIPAEMLVFTDESAICERDLMRVNGRSQSGKRVTRWMKQSNPKRYSLLPAISLDGVLAMTVREGSINRERFEIFLEFQLLPAMNQYPNRNSILVMDNCPIHCGGQIAELCERRGVRLIYLPPYCPEFNPIEMCFSVVKARFKRTGILESSGPEADWPIRQTVYETFTPLLMAQLYDGCGYALPPDMIEDY